MSRPVRAAVAAALLALALVGLTPAAPAVAAEKYTVKIDGGDAAYIFILCLKTTTTVKTYPAGNGDRVCSGKKGSPNGNFELSAEYTSGDTVWMDVEMMVDTLGHSRTKDNLDITGSHSCKISGALYAGKFKCDGPINKTTFATPSISPYPIDLDNPKTPVVQLLSLMAWCVSAAAVVGLLITGMTMASQLRRGALEEQTQYTRQIAIVFAACLIATTAGPIVEALGFSR
ncbi:hypothetical protein [Micromonospora okii]|uniref:hypothetical protein n=1 Tax=Micromonospora okii TaxID=1182970 RepID=UPI001E3BDEF2|nr:hypothetical protein [Micromonospora okii]